MSRYVNLWCVDCGEQDETDGINHGEEQFREVARFLPHLRPLIDAGWDEFCNGWGNYVDLVARFLIEHEGHKVVFKDEYGDRAPMDAGEGQSQA